jgi:hypothetical protein
VWVGMRLSSVGKSQVVVMLTVFVMVSGAGPHVYLSVSVVTGGGVVDGATGVN